MSFWCARIVFLCSLFPALAFATARNLRAQAPEGALTGVVTDPSGSVVAKVVIKATSASGALRETTTNQAGVYELKDLAPGTYTLMATAKGFAVFVKEGVQILAGQTAQANISLVIQVEEQKVEVTETTTSVEVDPTRNAGMVVLREKDLEALSDDPDELQSELQALAGPSAGPNGGQMYIDGFTAGELPPKASIREIRINQNPFSTEYDKLGYGRVEIFTKPGTDQFHGRAFLTGNTAAFNTRNPFEGGALQPGYYSTQYSAEVGGPLSKKASFFFNIERRNLHELSVIDTPIVDPSSLQITPFNGIVPNPRTRTNISQRIDYQVTPSNTLTARYQYWRNNESGDGIGTFNLASVGYNLLNTEHTFQATDTQVISTRTINETRFQYIHQNNNQNPLSTAPAIQVQGAFLTGGSGNGITSDTQNRYELQNITYMNFGKHSVKYGGRLRSTQDDNSSNARFNGLYNFGPRPDPTISGCNVSTPPASCPLLTGIQAYLITLQYLAAGNTPANMLAAITHGGGASFYSLNYNPLGLANAAVSWFDGALFVQDDWRLKPNVTLSYGLRYETQNDLGDHADFAPRFGLAWGIDGNGKNKSPKTVLRAGFGIFYDRFTSDLVLQQELQNGVIQQPFLVQNPTFFNPTTAILPSQFQTSTTPPQTIYKVNPNLRSPYTMQTGVSLERQLTRYANLSLTYLNSRGVHQLYTNFINATPLGQAPPPQIDYQYQSGGTFKQNQLIVNSSIRMGQNLSFFGYYTLNFANSDTAGPNYIPSNPLNLAEDYGRASFDVRHRAFFGGSMALPAGFRVSPFMIASSGVPFNITTGQDIYGNAAFNIRPSYGSCATGATGVRQTVYGCFTSVATPGLPPIPINDFTGPGRFTFNLRLSKTFGFGAKKESAASGGSGGPMGGTFGRPGGHGGGMFGAPNNYRYNLTFAVSARNMFNNVNLANPIGNLSSPLFGQSNALITGPFATSTANRRIDMQVFFTF